MRPQPEHGILAVLAVTCTVGGGALLWAMVAERHFEDAVEERLGAGACGRPSASAPAPPAAARITRPCSASMPDAGHRYLCVRGRSGDVACAETFAGGPER